ncbi:MAG: DNRLRE domain-containing protein, partial [Opitutaceae bacterium]
MTIRRAFHLSSQTSFSLALVIGVLVTLPSPSTRAASVTLTPGKDNTIYGSGDANLSNGAGQFIFAGSSGAGRVLRGLIAFNLAGQIPAGATINSVTLTLAINTPLSANSNTVRLHRVTADWGEGTSVAPMGGGGGAPAGTGDATWTARIFNTANWTTPGGDFSSTVSASQLVSGSSGTAVFTSPGLTADVQA